MIDKIKKHWIVSSLFLIIIISIGYMFVTDTLSYPYIMAERQVQMIKYCYFGSSEFSTTEYGFSLKVPEEYCLLPNRIFPADGTVQVVPKGFYFVINEYARGSIIKNSKSTLLFEPIASDRNTPAVLDALKKGNFLSDSIINKKINQSGLEITIAKNVKGLDETSHYDWAFMTHPNGKIFLSILLSNTDTRVFDEIISNIKAI